MRPLPGGEGAQAAALALALVALTVAVYAPVRSFDFVSYDDWELVRDNPALRAGLTVEGLKEAFSTRFHYYNWVPLTSLSYLLDYELYGLAPGGYHATSLALHLLATLLLFGALRRLCGALGPSAFAAAVFALHPLHVEAVAWISSRKDVVSGVSFAAALWAYAAYAERPGALRFLAVLALCVLGLMAKPVLVTLPFVLLLLDLWPLGRLAPAAPSPWQRLVGEKLLLLLPALAVSLLVLQLQPVVVEGGHPLDVRIANAVDATGAYLRASLWPSDLAAFYPHPGPALPRLRLLGAGFLLTLLTLAALGAWRSRPHWTVGWLWLLGMLFPVLGLVEVGIAARADRYTYLPLIGPALAVGWEAHLWTRHRAWRRPAAALLAAAWLLGLAWLSRQQLEHWRDSRALYRRILAVNGPTALAHHGLAGVLAQEGRLDEARDELRQAIEADPGWPVPWLQLGELELARGDGPAAARVYRHLLGFRPEDPALHAGLARASLLEGRADTAERHYGLCLGLDPARLEDALQLAWLLATHPRSERRDPERARQLLERALPEHALPSEPAARDPSLLDVWAAVLGAQGRLPEARRLAEQAAAEARAAGAAGLASDAERRAALYRSGRPYVQPAPVAARPGLLHPEHSW